MYLETKDYTAATLPFLYEKRTRSIGGMITDNRRPLPVTQIRASVIYLLQISQHVAH